MRWELDELMGVGVVLLWARSDADYVLKAA